MFTPLKASSITLALVLALTACDKSADTQKSTVKAESADAVASTSVASANSEKPYFSATENATIKSKIVEINLETRQVTLEMEDGERLTLTTEENGYDIDKIAVGDAVLVDYMRNVTIAVVSAEHGEAGAIEALTMARSEDPSAPAVVAVKEQVVVATVEDINIAANTFKLKGPEGNVQEFIAQDPENLKRSSVGDIVVFSSTEAIMLAVKVTPTS